MQFGGAQRAHPRRAMDRDPFANRILNLALPDRRPALKFTIDLHNRAEPIAQRAVDVAALGWLAIDRVQHRLVRTLESRVEEDDGGLGVVTNLPLSIRAVPSPSLFLWRARSKCSMAARVPTRPA
jgi:hypothetical protein